ncbi:anthrone oxygenase family protein [Sphingobacterium multivorum]|uniref:anthrone oxygenase family protein n=1 Tax=Sphingobacterium multivorum TaxID=28454 RepID=UPI0028A2D03E|nr:anthrone oxygenase family protein [Sphingobacterium multivorum]
MKLQDIILALATIFSAIISGLFFSYTFSVNLGLQKLNDKAYLTAMQNINKEILNSAFYCCFLGAPILLLMATILFFDLSSPKFYLILVACLSYIIGVIVVTGTQNVPLNNQLASIDLSISPEKSLRLARDAFEKPWVFWNNIRTCCSLLTLTCLIINLVFFKARN